MSRRGFFSRIFRRKRGADGERVPKRGRKARGRAPGPPPPSIDFTDMPAPEDAAASDEPWYRQSGPIFSESFTDRPPPVLPAADAADGTDEASSELFGVPDMRSEAPGSDDIEAQVSVAQEPSADAADEAADDAAVENADDDATADAAPPSVGPYGGSVPASVPIIQRIEPEPAPIGPSDAAEPEAEAAGPTWQQAPEPAAGPADEPEPAPEASEPQKDDAPDVAAEGAPELAADESDSDQADESDTVAEALESPADDTEFAADTDATTSDAAESLADSDNAEAATESDAEEAAADADGGEAAAEPTSAVAPAAPPQPEGPSIIPIRGYYVARTEDTLRSVAAQFLNAPERWSELQSLNAAYPGVADAGPDTLLAEGTALALPGDPLAWGRPDPVYLWTLAETFLFTAWGREPTPEEVVPFWRGLSSGALPAGEQAPALGTELPGIESVTPPSAPTDVPPAAPPPAFAMPPVAPEAPDDDAEPPDEPDDSAEALVSDDDLDEFDEFDELDDIEIEDHRDDFAGAVDTDDELDEFEADTELQAEADELDIAEVEDHFDDIEPVLDADDELDGLEPGDDQPADLAELAEADETDADEIDIEDSFEEGWELEDLDSTGEEHEPPPDWGVPDPEAEVDAAEPDALDELDELEAILDAEDELGEFEAAAEQEPEADADVLEAAPEREPEPAAEPADAAAAEAVPVDEAQPAEWWEEDELDLAEELEPVEELEPLDEPSELAELEPVEEPDELAEPEPDADLELIDELDDVVAEDDVAAEAEIVAADLAEEFYAEAELVDESAEAEAASPPIAPPPSPLDEPLAPPQDFEPPPLPEAPIAPPQDFALPPLDEPLAPPQDFEPPPLPEAPVAPSIPPPPPSPEGIAPPPSFDAWEASGGTSLDDASPYAGLTELDPFDTSYRPAEAEAPQAPQFLPSITGSAPAAHASARRVRPQGRSMAGTAVGDAMMLWQLARRRRSGRAGAGASAVELTLEQTANSESLALIEAAMRHLWAVTVGQGQPSPNVLAVRVGTYGFEVLLEQPTAAPPGWRSASDGYVLELPQGVTAHDLGAVGPGPSLCPALVPVGNTFEGPLLLNLQQIGALAVSGPSGPVTSMIGAIVATLASSPMASDIDITAVGMDAAASSVGWERVRLAQFDSAELNALLEAKTDSDGFVDERHNIVFFGPGHDLLIQRAQLAATSPFSRLTVVGATSAVGTRWPWSIHVDGTGTAVVQPVAITMTAAQAPSPEALALMNGGPQAGFDPLGPQ